MHFPFIYIFPTSLHKDSVVESILSDFILGKVESISS